MSDDRDIFDKALDYAPEAIGALVGGALLRRKLRRWYRKGGPGTVSRRPQKNEAGPFGMRYSDDALITRFETPAEFQKSIRNFGRAGAITGGAGGALVGAAADRATGYSKRRKK